MLEVVVGGELLMAQAQVLGQAPVVAVEAGLQHREREGWLSRGHGMPPPASNHTASRPSLIRTQEQAVSARVGGRTRLGETASHAERQDDR